MYITSPPAEVAFSRALCTTPVRWHDACRRLQTTPVRRVQTTDMAGVDAFVDATVAALALPQARVSISIALPVRSALQTAYATAALTGVSTGKPTLFLGPGSRRILHDIHGLPWGSPVANLRDFADSVQAILRSPRGTAVSTAGRHPTRGEGLGVGPEDLALGVGGHGPRVLGLAPAFGTALAIHIPTPRDTIERRVSEAFPQPPAPRVEVGVMTALHPDEAEAIRLARLELASFLTTLGPDHPRRAESLGQERAEQLASALANGITETAVALTDEEVRSMVLVATPASFVDDLRRWAPADALLPVPVGMFAGPRAMGAISGTEADRVRQLIHDSFFEERNWT